MTNIQFINDKQVSKRLLIFMLLLGSFAFSGYSNTTCSFQQQSIRTELFCPDKTRSTGRTILYRQQTVQHYTPIIFYNSPQSITLLHYSRIIKVKQEYISKLFDSFKSPIRFSQLKTNSQNLTVCAVFL